MSAWVLKCVQHCNGELVPAARRTRTISKMMKPAATKDIEAPASVASVRSLQRRQAPSAAAMEDRVHADRGAAIDRAMHAYALLIRQVTWGAFCRSPHCGPEVTTHAQESGYRSAARSSCNPRSLST